MIHLTEREKGVAKLIASGNKGQQIARRLLLSRKTVETHRSNIYRKLGIGGEANPTVLLTHYAIRNGIIPLLDLNGKPVRGKEL